MSWWRRAPKEPALAEALSRLASRVDTIESNAVRDSHDDASIRSAELVDIKERIDRLSRSVDGGFKLISDRLLVNQERLEEQQKELEARVTESERVVSRHDQRLTALEARKELTP